MIDFDSFTTIGCTGCPVKLWSQSDCSSPYTKELHWPNIHLLLLMLTSNLASIQQIKKGTKKNFYFDNYLTTYLLASDDDGYADGQSLPV